MIRLYNIVPFQHIPTLRMEFDMSLVIVHTCTHTVHTEEHHDFIGSENIKEASATTESDIVMSNVVQIERNQEAHVKTLKGGALLCLTVLSSLSLTGCLRLASFLQFVASLVFFELSPQVCRV